MTIMTKQKNFRSQIIVLGVVLTIFIFLIDVYFSSKFDTEFTYLLVLLLTFWIPGRRITFDTTIVVSCLIIVAYFISPYVTEEYKPENGIDLTNRLFAIVAIAAGAFAVIKYKISQEAVAKDQERLDALFQYATEGIIISNSKGEIVLANPRAEFKFGYEKGTMVGVSIDALIPSRFMPKHSQYRKDFYSHPVAKPMGKGRELFARKKDGTEFPVEISLSTFKIKDELFVISFIINITERKKQEDVIEKATDELREKTNAIERLNEELENRVKQRTQELAEANRALGESNKNLHEEVEERARVEEALRESQKLYSTIAHNFPDGVICVLDKTLHYIFIDGKELKELGMTKEHFIGKNIREIFFADEINDLPEQLQRVFNWESISQGLRFRGQEYTMNAVPLPDSKGIIKEVLVVISNTTELKRAEQEILSSLEKEKELNELKSKFVSIASHEFRTPLSTILSSVSLIAKYDKPEDIEKKNKHIERIKSSVKSLTEILNDFLSLEKLEAGKVEKHDLLFDLVDFSEELCEELQTVAKAGQQIICHHEGEKRNVQLDKQILRNALINLVNNAIKYSPEGKNIYFNSRIDDAGVFIEIKDEGMGIPEEDQEHLFERFFRAQNVTAIQGTGLGLNIVNRYIKLMGGKINFESRVNKGSTFTVSFPNGG
jgi:PAS domain S-box-containing protein